MGRRLYERGLLTDPRYERAYFHMVDADDAVAGLRTRSKFDTSWSFLRRLKDQGRRAAERWLGRHRDSLGRGSTLDLSQWDPAYGQAPHPSRPTSRRRMCGGQ